MANTFRRTMIDKRDWPLGPWVNEADYALWRHGRLWCAIIRDIESGVLCGYVGLPRDHPSWGATCDDLTSAVKCHGGLTHAAHQLDVPGADAWWLGFHCGHEGDRRPVERSMLTGIRHGLRDAFRDPDGREQYRGWEYVESEIEALAAQLETP